MNSSGLKTFLKKAFPVPRALVLSDACVSVSDGVLRYFEFSRSRGVLSPKSFGSVPFPRTKTESDEKARGEAVVALKAMAAERSFYAVHSLIHEGEAYVFKVKVPISDAVDLRQAIEISLEENVPIPPSDVLFEYEVVRADTGRRETTVAVSAVSMRAISEQAGLLSAAGLFPISFETEGRAMARALIPAGDAATHAILAIFEKHSVVSIVERGIVTFSSSVEVGSTDLDAALAKTFGITPAAARALRSDQSAGGEPGETKVFEALIPVYSTIRDELAKVLVYARGQARKDGAEEDVADVILAGGDALVPGFSRYISLMSKLPAKEGSVWTNVLSVDKEIPRLSRRDSLDYAAVIGSLI